MCKTVKNAQLCTELGAMLTNQFVPFKAIVMEQIDITSLQPSLQPKDDLRESTEANLICCVSISERELFDKFKTVGRISSSIIKRNENWDSQAFLSYLFPDNARQAIETFNGDTMKGQVLRVKHFHRLANNICLKNLGEDYNKAKIESLCAGYGTIESSTVSLHRNGKCQGYVLSTSQPQKVQRSLVT